MIKVNRQWLGTSRPVDHLLWSVISHLSSSLPIDRFRSSIVLSSTSLEDHTWTVYKKGINNILATVGWLLDLRVSLSSSSSSIKVARRTGSEPRRRAPRYPSTMTLRTERSLGICNPAKAERTSSSFDRLRSHGFERSNLYRVLVDVAD